MRQMLKKLKIIIINAKKLAYIIINSELCIVNVSRRARYIADKRRIHGVGRTAERRQYRNGHCEDVSKAARLFTRCNGLQAITTRPNYERFAKLSFCGNNSELSNVMSVVEAHLPLAASTYNI